MGRPKCTKLDPIKFRAERDNETKEFQSRHAANLYAAGARRRSGVEPIYWKCRYWVLDVERAPLPGEEHFNREDQSSVILSEREAVLKGGDPELLKGKAEGLRRASFERQWPLFQYKNILKQLAPDSRNLALACFEKHYERLDERIDRQEVEKEKKRTEAEARAKEAAIPTIEAVFEEEVKRRVDSGRIERNTADSYRYEASAFKIVTSTSVGRQPLSEAQVHHLSSDSITEWFGLFAARKTRFGRLPTTKTCINALTHLRSVGKALRRADVYREFHRPFEVVDVLIEELSGAKRGSDGWRNRHRLTNESILKLINSCATDLERGAVALMLAGPRPPSEPVAAKWADLEYDPAGNLWWHVVGSAIELVGGELELRAHTKTQDVDFRQLNIPGRFVPWIEALRGTSDFILGTGNTPIRPSEFTEMVEEMFSRTEVEGSGISIYSLRHTVADEVERILGRTARDLVLHGRRDRTTGSLHYSHAQRDRRRAELTIDGKPYGEHLDWSKKEGL